MRKKTLLFSLAFSVSPLAALLGQANVWAGPGDDALAVFVLGNYSHALQLAKPAAEKDDFMAKFVLARILSEGKGAPQDKTEADKWFQQTLRLTKPSAESGDPRAQFVLGRMHHSGWVLPKDLAQAVAWYRKSADQGYAYSQINLGACYAAGEGVAKDASAAVAWYRKAAEQGLTNAQVNLGIMYESGEGVPKDETEAVAWYRKAAEQGSIDGQVRLGACYALGEGVSRDEREAFAWYRKAADQGNAVGQAKLGLMYANGSGVTKDEREAVAWYRKAADQGLALAQLMLGHMYFKGNGVPEDLKLAVAWYRKAADQDNDGGQNMLGTMYQFGQGVPRDIPEAISWYRKAAAHGNTHAKDSLRELGAPWIDAQSTPASNSISKDDLRDMIQAALKTNAESQAPAAPKTITSDVDKPGYTTPENADNFAVVIGVEKYASLPAADFADRDAEAMRAHLLASGYPARNIYFLSGQQATRAKIAQSVNSWLPGRVTPASTVFFYYSGHGAPDPKTSQAYLVPMDGDPEDLDSTAYPIKLLYEKLGMLQTKHVIVALDSCFSGAGGRSVLAKGTRPLVGKIDLGGLPENVVALTASDKSQISGALEDQGHGTFTYFMLKGLSGEAKNDAGHVTMQSLYKYLTPKVQDAARMHNRDQTPQLLNSKQAGATLR